MDRLGLWPLRLVWLAVPPAVGPAVGAALVDASDPVRITALVLGWAGWSAAFLATLVPRAVSLTVLRVVAPWAPVAAAWAATGPGSTTARAIGLGWAALAAVLAFVPSFGEALVDGSSYGDERRVLLRVPAPLLVGPVPLAWGVATGGVAGGALLLAAEQWAAGAALLVIGVVGGRPAAVRLHQLSRRWLVFVPAGVVVHDPLALGDPTLFPRATIASLGPAAADTDALDLTRGALGLALELRTTAPVRVAPLRPRGETGEVAVERLLVAPTRPGHVLAIAAERRVPVAAGGLAGTAVRPPRRRST